MKRAGQQVEHAAIVGRPWLLVTNRSHGGKVCLVAWVPGD